MVAFKEAVLLADATQGGIPFYTALSMTMIERHAAIEIINEQREKDKPKKKRGG